MLLKFILVIDALYLYLQVATFLAITTQLLSTQLLIFVFPHRLFASPLKKKIQAMGRLYRYNGHEKHSKELLENG